MRLAILFLLVLGCATASPTRDSPQYRACKLVCEAKGAHGASVVEDEDSLACLCKMPPETT